MIAGRRITTAPLIAALLVAALLAAALLAAALLAASCMESTTGSAMNGPDLAGEGTSDLGAGGDGSRGVSSYQVVLTAAAEVPVCSTAGAGAMGAATVTVDSDGQRIVVSDLTWSNLSGAAQSAHLFFGAPGAQGAIIFTFTPPITRPIRQTFTATDYPGTVRMGAPTTFAAFVAALMAGQAYINIQTSACGGGEIRGPVQ